MLREWLLRNHKQRKTHTMKQKRKRRGNVRDIFSLVQFARKAPSAMLLVLFLALPLIVAVALTRHEFRQNAGGLPTPTPTPAAFVMSVNIQNMQFIPQTPAFSAGTTVTWTNNDIVSHTVVSDDPTGAEAWSSGILAPGQSFRHTFMTPGYYNYHCSLYPSMRGSVYVTGKGTLVPTHILLRDNRSH